MWVNEPVIGCSFALINPLHAIESSFLKFLISCCTKNILSPKMYQSTQGTYLQKFDKIRKLLERILQNRNEPRISQNSRIKNQFTRWFG